MASILGYISAVLLICILTFFPAKMYCLKQKQCKYFTKIFRGYEVLGILLVITAFIHGYLMLGNIKMHSGTVLIVFVVILMMFSRLGRRVSNRWIGYHKALSFVVLILFLIHILSPRWF